MCYSPRGITVVMVLLTLEEHTFRWKCFQRCFLTVELEQDEKWKISWKVRLCCKTKIDKKCCLGDRGVISKEFFCYLWTSGLKVCLFNLQTDSQWVQWKILSCQRKMIIHQTSLCLWENHNSILHLQVCSKCRLTLQLATNLPLLC